MSYLSCIRGLETMSLGGGVGGVAAPADSGWSPILDGFCITGRAAPVADAIRQIGGLDGLRVTLHFLFMNLGLYQPPLVSEELLHLLTCGLVDRVVDRVGVLKLDTRGNGKRPLRHAVDTRLVGPLLSALAAAMSIAMDRQTERRFKWNNRTRGELSPWRDAHLLVPQEGEQRVVGHSRYACCRLVPREDGRLVVGICTHPLVPQEDGQRIVEHCREWHDWRLQCW